MREPVRFSWTHAWNWILALIIVAGIILWRFYGLDGRLVLALAFAWLLFGRIFTPWVINEHIGFLDKWVFHDYNKAHTRYRKAIDSGKASANAYCALASLALGEGDIVEAASLLEEAVTRLPRDYHVHALLARVLARLGRYDEAVAAAIRVKEISNRSPFSYMVLGEVLKAKGELTAALSAYEKALDGGLRAKECYPGMAEIYLSDGKVDEALKIIKEGYKRFPGDPDILYWLGRVFLAKGDKGTARKYLESAMTKRPPRDYAYQVPYKELVKALALCTSPV